MGHLHRVLVKAPTAGRGLEVAGFKGRMGCAIKAEAAKKGSKTFTLAKIVCRKAGAKANRIVAHIPSLDHQRVTDSKASANQRGTKEVTGRLRQKEDAGKTK